MSGNREELAAKAGTRGYQTETPLRGDARRQNAGEAANPVQPQPDERGYPVPRVRSAAAAGHRPPGGHTVARSAGDAAKARLC